MSDIDKAIERLHRSQRALAKAIVDLCPGDHEYVQHRDGNPAWCQACHRTASGRVVER